MKKILGPLKVIAIVYGLLLLLVTAVYGIDSLFPTNDSYPHMRYLLKDVVVKMWVIPFMVTFFIIFATGIIFPIFIHEMKRINSQEKTWTLPNWGANIIITILLVIPGGFILGLLSEFVYEIPKGPWNFVPIIVLGYIFLHIAHSICRKIVPFQLARITKLILG